MVKVNDNIVKIRSLFIAERFSDKSITKQDFIQIGIWDSDYEYLTLEEAKQLRQALNTAIIKMTFKTKQ